MSKITESIIDELNEELEQKDSAITVKYIEDNPVPMCQLILKNQNMIDSYDLYPSSECIHFIEKFTRNKKIEIEWVRLSDTMYFKENIYLSK